MHGLNKQLGFHQHRKLDSGIALLQNVDTLATTKVMPLIDL